VKERGGKIKNYKEKINKQTEIEEIKRRRKG
jgi:hypothetical protein